MEGHEQLETIEIDDDNRESFIRLLDYFKSIQSQTVPIVAESSKWLLASLLAVNGGALLSLLSSQKIAASIIKLPAIFWLAGLVLALGVGVASLITGLKSLSVIGAYITKIEEALASGVMKQPSWQADGSRLDKMRKWPWLMGCSSAFCFLAGAVALAAQFDANPTPAPPAPDTRRTATAPVDPRAAHAPDHR